MNILICNTQEFNMRTDEVEKVFDLLAWKFSETGHEVFFLHA